MIGDICVACGDLIQSDCVTVCVFDNVLNFHRACFILTLSNNIVEVKIEKNTGENKAY